ncbi:MAG: dockerin type I domain-containing protein, partial [Pirellula sp.]
MASKRSIKKRFRSLLLESLERREVFAGSSLHNSVFPEDVNGDSNLSPLDALVAINTLNGPSLKSSQVGEAEATNFPDVDNDGDVTPLDVLGVINTLNERNLLPEASGEPPMPPAMPPAMPGEVTLKTSDVEILLQRAAMATTSEDAIIAVVDRAGRILGVRAEQEVINMYLNQGRKDDFVFAVDGAVAKARTAASFSNSQAPLTSRTVRFISQSTMTQREVQSNPNILDPNSPRRGPGFVAPIGLGGHFPPQVANTPLVDLLMIEHQGRDGSMLPGSDGIKGTMDDLDLSSRFNVDMANVPSDAQAYLTVFPESYGTQSGLLPRAQNRGFATLPGGIPIYKFVEKITVVNNAPVKETVPVLVGGIGVFFPGPDGLATYEQSFVHASQLKGVAQTELQRLNAPKVLESEFIAFFATGGTVVGPGATSVKQFEGKAPPLPPDIKGISGRIDLVGITLEIYGPHPTQYNTAPSQVQLLNVGQKTGGGQGENSGTNQRVLPNDTETLDGMTVPEGWLVKPHASKVDNLTAADVDKIIKDGIQQAEKTRAAIRLNKQFKPGVETRMVFSVADSTGEVLGLYRMPDATVFSIDVAVAKSRNTAYYASNALVPADQVDANNDGNADVPKGTAFTNRTFRFLAAPRFPTGAPTGTPAGDFSMLLMPGINPKTGENADPNMP